MTSEQRPEEGEESSSKLEGTAGAKTGKRVPGPHGELGGGPCDWSWLSEEGRWITYRALCVRVGIWDFILIKKVLWGFELRSNMVCFIS